VASHFNQPDHSLEDLEVIALIMTPHPYFSSIMLLA